MDDEDLFKNNDDDTNCNLNTGDEYDCDDCPSGTQAPPTETPEETPEEETPEETPEDVDDDVAPIEESYYYYN